MNIKYLGSRIKGPSTILCINLGYLLQYCNLYIKQELKIFLLNSKIKFDCKILKHALILKININECSTYALSIVQSIGIDGMKNSPKLEEELDSLNVT